MSIFVDASALVSMLAGEADGDWLALTMLRAGEPITSAVAIWQATTALHKNHRLPLEEARLLVAQYVEQRHILVVPIGATESQLALDAFDRFGKGRHPARLNMGDCFAYACAKANGAKLLYKGDDFALTDLA